MHMHLVMFQILDRTPITMVADSVVATGPPMPPDAVEAGWKDTALAMAGETVEVLVRFDSYRGVFPLHCHNLQHEDMGMMLNIEVT